MMKDITRTPATNSQYFFSLNSQTINRLIKRVKKMLRLSRFPQKSSALKARIQNGCEISANSPNLPRYRLMSWVYSIPTVIQ